MPQPQDAKTIAVANLTPPVAPVEPTDFSDLNDPPGDLDQLPPAPASPATPAAATPAAPSGTPPATAPISHPMALIQAARDLGIRDSVIRALPTDDLIAHTIDLQRKLSALDTNDARRRQELPVEPLPTARPANEESDDAVLDYLEKDLGADPKLVKLLRTRFKKQDELEQAEVQRRQRDQGEATRRQNSSEEAIDAAFERLGPKFSKLFGEGAFRAMPEGAQRSKRLAVFRNAGIDFQNDSERTIERKIAKAALEVYGDVLPADEPSPAAANAYADSAKANGHKTNEEWDAATLAKPTATKPTKTKGQKAAAEAIRDQMQEWGIHAGSPADEFDGIPN